MEREFDRSFMIHGFGSKKCSQLGPISWTEVPRVRKSIVSRSRLANGVDLPLGYDESIEYHPTVRFLESEAIDGAKTTTTCTPVSHAGTFRA